MQWPRYKFCTTVDSHFSWTANVRLQNQLLILETNNKFLETLLKINFYFTYFKHMFLKHTIFLFENTLFQFNKKLDINSLFTFAARHIPTEDKNTPMFEHASTCTE
jgi:hypothetical protein